jgi:ABC-type uncharacterized transport system ATPase subunit
MALPLNPPTTREAHLRLADERDPASRILRADHLTKTYAGRSVVKGVSIEVRSGEVVGLLGPNGAGKTTTFYMIVGLTRPNGGRVFLGDVDVTELPMYQRARSGISYLPQEPSVFRKLTVEENILAILETLDLTPTEREERLTTLLDELSIAHLRKNRAHSLSGGERRRLEICSTSLLPGSTHSRFSTSRTSWHNSGSGESESSSPITTSARPWEFATERISSMMA